MECENAPECEAGQPIADERAADPAGGMATEQCAAEGPSWKDCEYVKREVRQRPGAGDDHGYNSGAEGDDQNGTKHATAKYHDRHPAAAASGYRPRLFPSRPPR